MRLYLALTLLVLATVAQCKPVDDDTPAAPVDEKKDTVENADSASKPSDESAALSDNPINDPSSDLSDADKRQTITTSTTTTVAPETTTTTTTTAAPPPIPMETTTTTTTTAAPDSVDEQTVEGSENNTRTLKGTTFHAAILDKSVEYYDEMNTNLHDIHRHSFMTVIAKVYEDYPEYKQAVIIKFTKAGSDSKTRATIPDSDGVVVDFYLRFFTAGKHLAKLTDAIKTGKLFTHDVHPLFIRAYVAEPTGLVCTPDCKVQCYSYCDAGCCHLNIVQNVQLPTPSPVEEFIQNQQHALKTGQTTPKPCENDECKPQEQQQQQQQPMIMPMPMGMPQQMPCQGAACQPPMMQMMPQMPCQGAACGPQPMMPQQMPCQGAACGPQPMMPQRMPCQGAACGPPPMMPQQMPCQGAACGPPPMMPQQMPCQGAACQPPMMQMMPQMPCQGAACPQPMMPPMMPQMMPQMCPPSCGQICAPACPNQCCNPGARGR